MFWGAGAGVAVSLFMSPVPIFQRDVLHRFPFVSSDGNPLAAASVNTGGQSKRAQCYRY